jgi:hypothetical protein
MTFVARVREYFSTRPKGEWIFLVLMLAQGVNAVYNGFQEDALGLRQQSVRAGDIVIGLSALGIVWTTIVGDARGLGLLWVFAAAASYTGPMAAYTYGGAPWSGVLSALAGTLVVDAFVIWYGTRRLYGAITQRRWPDLVAEHARAADEFVAAIESMPGTVWTSRRGPEDWSPAEITDHLARTYSQFAGEARGKNSLRIRLPFIKRIFARVFIKPQLLNGRPFPKARAPRELRPSAGPATPADGVALFRATGDACLRDLGILVQRRPYRQLVHPYLGGLPLYEIVLVASQHIRHHRRQLPS